MKRFLVLFSVAAVSATVYCAQYVDFHPYSDVDMQMRFRVKNMANPVNPQDAATKKYVDDAISGGGAEIVTVPMLDEAKAELRSYSDSGDTNAKAYAADKALTAEQNARNYTDVTTSSVSSELSSAIDGKVSKAGDVMSGDLSMGHHKISGLSSPEDEYDAVNKKYLSSNYLPKNASSHVGGDLDFDSSHGILNVKVSGPNYVVPRSYVDASDADTLSAAKAYTDSRIPDDCLPLSGGTMLGVINMNNYRVTGLPSPLYSSDAASKSYVDARYNESLDFYYFDGFVFSLSPTNFSSRAFDFSFPAGSSSGTIYAKLLGCGTRYTKLGWLLKSADHSSSDFSSTVSTVSGRGYDPGDVIAFHISTTFPLEVGSQFTATFQVYDDNHSASACLITFSGQPSPPPPVPSYSFVITLLYGNTTSEIDPDEPHFHQLDELAYNSDTGKFDFSFDVYNSPSTEITEPITFTFTPSSSSVAPSTLSSAVSRGQHSIFGFSSDPDSEFSVECSTSVGTRFSCGLFRVPSAPPTPPADL